MSSIITPDAPPPLVVPDLSGDVDGFIRRYIQIRDKKDEIKKRHTAELRPYNDALEALDAGFLKLLNDTSLDNVSAKGAGTAYKKVTKRATIKDGDSFRRHVIGAELWDLVDWRANAPAIQTAINETQLEVPGVKYSEEVTIGVRRA